MIEPWKNRHAIAKDLERATLNWFAMGAKPDSPYLITMRECYNQLLDIDTAASIESDRAEGLEGEITIPVTRELRPDEGRTFTIEATCHVCQKLFTMSGQVLMVGQDLVHVRVACQHCQAMGEYSLQETEFNRLFPRGP